MTYSPLACPNCQAGLPRSPEITAGRLRCYSCGKDLDFTLFPALDREPPKGDAGELLVVDGEASCFYHAAKRAVVPCVACGRFLCALCDVEIDGRHYCAACFEKGTQVGASQELERKRTRYDKIAMLLVTLPLLFFCVVPLTSPVAAFVAVRYWNAPPSQVENTRLRLAGAFILAVLEFFGSIAFIHFILKGQKH